MEQPVSQRPRLRAIVVLVLALAVLLASVTSSHWRAAAARPATPAPAQIQLPSAPALERAEDGPKLCVGPHPVEGPAC